MRPPIFTYRTEDPDAPARLRCAAAMDQTAPGRHWVAFGATEDEARAKLAGFWDKAEGPDKAKVKAAARSPVPAAASIPADDGDEAF